MLENLKFSLHPFIELCYHLHPVCPDFSTGHNVFVPSLARHGGVLLSLDSYQQWHTLLEKIEYFVDDLRVGWAVTRAWASHSFFTRSLVHRVAMRELGL
jgi:hypothetical protein